MLRWPPGEPLALPPDLLADPTDLAPPPFCAGVHEAANRGETANALVAGRLGDAVVITNDDVGKRLCPHPRSKPQPFAMNVSKPSAPSPCS
jgi:hypothetical protein